MTRSAMDRAIEALAAIADLRFADNDAGAEELLAEHGEQIADLLDLIGWEPPQ